MVSSQSKVIDSRAVLEDSLKALEAQAVNDQVKRPSHWGGYLVRPKSIEFWQGRPNRLHDRIRYTLEKDFNWTVERLAP
jgi:pyridoxamine 5'-phosphate oxidase